jgi:hypothetical protein
VPSRASMSSVGSARSGWASVGGGVKLAPRAALENVIDLEQVSKQ